MSRRRFLNLREAESGRKKGHRGVIWGEENNSMGGGSWRDEIVCTRRRDGTRVRWQCQEFLARLRHGLCGMPATPRQLMYMVEEGQRLFPQAPWETNATGRDQFRMNILGAAMGCDIVRVGFEDSVYLPDGKQAKSNYEQVEAMSELALKLGREIATPAEAWEILGGS